MALVHRRGVVIVDRETRSRGIVEVREDVRYDLRAAWQSLRRAPAFATVVIATLALGIGANAAIFSILERVLLDQLPYRAPDRIVRLYGASVDRPSARGMLSAREITTLQRDGRSFAEVAPFGLHGGFTYVSASDAEVWAGTRVGANFFRTLGTAAMLGRTISARDTGSAATPVVVLSYDLWQRAFGGDSGVLGRTVQLNGEARTIIGIMPPTFIAPTFTADIWVPLDLAPMLRTAANGRMFGAVARLADGTTLPRARAELRTIAGRLAQDDPQRGRPRLVNAVDVREAMVGQARPALLIVMGTAALVLVLMSVNLAGLFLARASARWRELAVRAAIGASRGRLVRMQLTECLSIAVVGGAAGVALAFWGKDVLLSVGAHVLPPLSRPPAIDFGVLGFAVLLALLSGLVVGLAPAILGARTDPGSALAESSRGAVGGRVRTRVGRLLVVVQIGAAVALLIGAGLLGRTLLALERAGVGYSTGSDVLTFRINLTSPRYPDAASRARVFEQLLERVRALPGVRAAGMTAVSPWNGPMAEPLVVQGSADDEASPLKVVSATVSDGFLEALGVRVLRGRALASADRADAPAVAAISEALARRRWRGADPIGARIRLGQDTAWREIVGVVADVRERASGDDLLAVYVPAAQAPSIGSEYVVRAADDAMTLVPAIRGELRALDTALPLVRPRTMDDVFRTSLANQRLAVVLAGVFAALALLLAALGVYGVVAHGVAARTRELGIRIALGGDRAGILWLVVRDMLGTALLGGALGVALAAVASRALAGALFGITPRDPATFVAAPVALVAVTLIASLVPAWSATRADPLEVLRAE